jgi:PAS domain S-box-containing protein
MNLDPGIEAELRSEARQRLASKQTWHEPDERMDQLRLIHELRVHQIELEMQNELLIETLSSVNALRAKYHDLYDSAPVGNFTLDLRGHIVELNLRAANMLGQDRAKLVDRPLREMFDPSCLPALDKLLSTAQNSTQEVFAQSLQILRPLPVPLYVNAQAHAFVEMASGQALIRLALMDVTALKMATDDMVQVINQNAGGSPAPATPPQPLGARS